MQQSFHGHHHEEHFTKLRLRDVVIDVSDGLIVPFVLAAGLSRAVANSSVIITAGIANLCRQSDSHIY